MPSVYRLGVEGIVSEDSKGTRTLDCTHAHPRSAARSDNCLLSIMKDRLALPPNDRRAWKMPKKHKWSHRHFAWELASRGVFLHDCGMYHQHDFICTIAFHHDTPKSCSDMERVSESQRGSSTFGADPEMLPQSRISLPLCGKCISSWYHNLIRTAENTSHRPKSGLYLAAAFVKTSAFSNQYKYHVCLNYNYISVQIALCRYSPSHWHWTSLKGSGVYFFLAIAFPQTVVTRRVVNLIICQVRPFLKSSSICLIIVYIFPEINNDPDNMSWIYIVMKSCHYVGWM